MRRASAASHLTLIFATLTELPQEVLCCVVGLKTPVAKLAYIVDQKTDVIFIEKKKSSSQYNILDLFI